MSASNPMLVSPGDVSGDAQQFDLILVGGGLQNGLITLATLSHDRARRIALIEREPRPGGNHTWCLHSRDVPYEARSWVTPLVTHAWAGYDVRFPGMSRTVTGSYSAVTSARFSERVLEVVGDAPGCQAFLGIGAREIGPSSVILDDGRVLNGELVVDARGPERKAPSDGCGFQKFLGLELEFEESHGVERPIVMDALVPQLDGYRFFYVLPLSPTRLLIEDTRFSTQPELDRVAVRAEVQRYAGRFGAIAGEVRQEWGVLPMPWRGDAIEPESSPLVAGYRGGFFHPATGYSFGVAIRLAQLVATTPPNALFGRPLHQLHHAHTVQSRYAQRLNWLLFNGFAPRDMWNVFERFYRLPDPLIHRFYALSLTASDRARILLGRPPAGFSLSAALKSTSNRLEDMLRPPWARERPR